ncbi:MalY/PatB family protein [uncultured Clostridium sp.]|uniref:MalY/PatB family protein n=1 Tax=uncultured Clostridium sp. TaxID=59620 RepID=UPI0025E16E2F|nr:MalY/PatB family protein [uncultured Clostridium sp.]
MQYDFTTVLNRHNIGASKWEDMKAEKPTVGDDIVPFSTADMEFKNPPEMIQSMKDYMDRAVLGYTVGTDAFYDAVSNWTKRRYNWETEKDWLVMTHGIVNAIHILTDAFTEPGDGVIVMTPSYYPFFAAIERNQCRLVTNTLINNGGYYEIDFDDLEKKACDPDNKLLLLSNPHNPVGRVWTEEEIRKIGEICIRNHVLVVSDEIHCDLIMPGHRHIPFASLSEEFQNCSITCMSPSKTFNTAGMQASTIFIPDRELRDTFIRTMLRHGQYNRFNALGFQLYEAAYTRCDEWLEQLLAVINSNRLALKEYIEANLPEVKLTEMEGTYLQWMDFSAFGIEDRELERILVEEGDLFLDPGYEFGEGGGGFERINLACPESVLMKGLERLVKVMRPYAEKIKGQEEKNNGRETGE